MTLRVRYNPTPLDLFANDRVRGVLTCDHAASSYGLPVFVGDGGQARGPAEVAELELDPDGISDLYVVGEAAAVEPGDDPDTRAHREDVAEADRTYTLRADVLAAIDAAKRAGYRFADGR